MGDGDRVVGNVRSLNLIFKAVKPVGAPSASSHGAPITIALAEPMFS